MAIQCGLCNNIMPSSSFLSHKERKHSMEQRVPYMKLPDDVLRSDSTGGPLVKCRYCPNRVPQNAMERHLQRSHVNCHLCSKTLLKSNAEKHMQQKHGMNMMMRTQPLKPLQQTNNLMNSIDRSPPARFYSSSLMSSAGLLGSCASMRSDGDLSDGASPDLLTEQDPPPVPYRPPPMPLTNPMIHQSPSKNPDFIRVTEWQLHNYMRQGRVYRKNGFLYLRNVDAF